MKKIKQEQKKKIIKVALLLLLVVLVSVCIFLLFNAFGITDITKLQNFIKSCGAWSWVIYLVIQVLCTILLCFVPATSATFITLGIVLFGANASTFILCFSGVLISSVCMDLIGRFGGSKIIIKLVGEKDYNRALELIQTKGIVYVPVMYLLPIFPDDAICMCCGACKLKWWVHYIEIFLCRGIGCATIIFGMNLLPVDLINNLKDFNWTFIGAHIFDYIEMITVIVFWVVVLLYLARKVDVFLEKRKNAKQD